MADRKVTDSSVLDDSQADRANDVIMVVDVDDPTDGASGTNKQMTLDELDYFDGSQAIKAVPFVGQVPTGNTAKEVLMNIFYPFISATLSLNSFSLAEVGEQITPQLIGTLTPNDETIITARDVLVGGVDSDNFLTNSINQAAPASITTNTDYRLRADVDDNGTPTQIFSPTRTQSFIYPFFYGMDANSSLSGTGLYSALTKLLQNQGDKTVLLSGTTEYAYFCYDDSYPNLSKIEDNNGFDVTGNFTQSTVSVTSIGLPNNYTKDFKVYRSNGLTTINANFKFLF